MSLNPLKILGGAEGDRTPDPKTASLVLSQLSYSPIIFLQRARVNVTSRPGDVKKKMRRSATVDAALTMG